MLQLKQYKGDTWKGYYGFTLQPNFWYGIDTETNQKIVTSGWENNGMVAIYYFNAGNSTWVLKWIDIEENDFLIEEIPKLRISCHFQNGLKKLKVLIGMTMMRFILTLWLMN